MNTEQKAREWLAEYDTKYVFVDAGNANEIITALLAERQALLKALKTLADEEWRDDDDEILIDARTNARVAIAMCEDKV